MSKLNIVRAILSFLTGIGGAAILFYNLEWHIAISICMCVYSIQISNQIAIDRLNTIIECIIDPWERIKTSTNVKD